ARFGSIFRAARKAARAAPVLPVRRNETPRLTRAWAEAGFRSTALRKAVIAPRWSFCSWRVVARLYQPRNSFGWRVMYLRKILAAPGRSRRFSRSRPRLVRQRG